MYLFHCLFIPTILIINSVYRSSVFCIRADIGSKKFRDFLQEWPTPGTGPYFEMSNSSVTALVSKTVTLHCRVKNLGNRTVSWVRHRDIHLLTVGRYTYTSDQRFEAVHTPHTEEWSLRIRYPQKKDSGVYECQISTTPPIGYPVYLAIVEPITEITGNIDIFINYGSTINLTCLVKYTPEAPSTVTWEHNKAVINFDSPRGGINLVTEKGHITTSQLLIQNAMPKDSGQYSCNPSNAKPATVRVHILNGEYPAAMHHGRASNVRFIYVQLLLILGAIMISNQQNIV